MTIIIFALMVMVMAIISKVMVVMSVLAIVDSHIAQVSKSNVNCLFCLLLTRAVLNIYVVIFSF